jgi:pyruvate/2-oxoacid:ferredoxin oxidoreductase alpha subunit
VADALCGLVLPLGCASYGVPEEQAEVGVLAWGSTAGVVREAVEGMAAAGYPVTALIPAVINPLPADRILQFASGLKTIVVPEVNRTGQFAAWVKAHTELHLVSLNKYGGLPFTPAEIRAKVMEFLVPQAAKTVPEPKPTQEVAHG